MSTPYAQIIITIMACNMPNLRRNVFVLERSLAPVACLSVTLYLHPDMVTSQGFWAMSFYREGGFFAIGTFAFLVLRVLQVMQPSAELTARPSMP